MRYLMILPYYFSWHYTRGIKELFVNLKNFLVFILHFFSIKTLSATLFSPFQRLKTDFNGGFEPGVFLGHVITNMIMRLVGFVIRSFFIITGLTTFIITLFLEIVFVFVWVFLPFVLFFLIFTSISSFFVN